METKCNQHAQKMSNHNGLPFILIVKKCRKAAVMEAENNDASYSIEPIRDKTENTIIPSH